METGGSTPLGSLLGGVSDAVFRTKPLTIGLREMQRDMSSILKQSRKDNQFLVLTNRGAPSFLVIPIDPEAWSSLLVATAPQFEHEIELATKEEASGVTLPTPADLLDGSRSQPNSDM